MEHLQEELFHCNPWWNSDYTPGLTPRPKYIRALTRLKTSRDILFITGLRRVGKSSIMKMYIEELSRVVSPKNILYVSLDSLQMERFPVYEIIREFRKINGLKRSEKIHLFFDEATYRDNIHLELKNLYDSENAKIVVSASSSSVLRDKKALLTGRTRVIEVQPLDFFEFLSFRKLSYTSAELYLSEKYFEEYLQCGGMPEYILTSDSEYLANLIDAILYKDIAFYHGVRDIAALKEFFRLMMERAGKQLSISKLSKIIGTSSETAKRYFDYFISVYLFYPVERCGKLNERLRSPKKLYAADLGLRTFITGIRDKGAAFENAFYLLIKDFSPCYILRNGIELDFYFHNTLVECKYERQIEGNQKKLFEEFSAKKKIIVNSVSNFLDFAKKSEK